MEKAYVVKVGKGFVHNDPVGMAAVYDGSVKNPHTVRAHFDKPCELVQSITNAHIFGKGLHSIAIAEYFGGEVLEVSLSLKGAEE